MPRGVTYGNLRRINLSIEKRLHKASVKRARDLDLPDGFSGYVARLLIKEMESPTPTLATMPRRFKKAS